MQIKGAIRFLAIMMAIISIFYLSFTVVTTSIRQDAKEYAQGDRERELAYLDSLGSEEVFNIGIKKFTFKECQEREINLGLDLKGGMNVILEISVEDLIISLSNNSRDTTFRSAIALAKEMKKESNDDFVVLFGRAFESIDPNARLAAIFNTIELRDKIDFNSSNEEVLRIIRNEAQGAIDNAFLILRSRIDRFGVVQPNIQKLETAGRILVELPGVKDQKRVRTLLQRNASLEFWETYTNQEIYGYLVQANEKVKEIKDAEKELQEEVAEEVAEETEVTEETETDITDLLTEDQEEGQEEELSLIEQLESDSIQQDSTSFDANQFADNYPLFALLQPMVNPRTNQLMDGSTIGMAHHKDTSLVNKYLNMPQVRSLFPRDVIFMWHVKPYEYDNSESYYELHAIKATGRDGRAPLDGDVVTDARKEFDTQGGDAKVTMSMNAEGSKVWARMTKNNIGKFLAIVLDGYVYSAPHVNVEIKGPTSIEGGFTVNEAEDLANVLKSGKLPARAEILQEEIVGPSLGKESIDSGMRSFLIAFIVILIYMVFYYSRRAGLVADFALIANMFFIMGVLASLGAVLTLPGIAGIVLTIGMSVDANVLIYERIREELTAGKGVKLALKDGYKNAYSAIIDANITTFLTALILYIFGTGPIKGFATTLLIGVVTSLFTAIFLTRLIFEWFLKRNKTITYSTKLTNNAFKNTKVKFLEKRKIFYVISGLIMVAAVASLSVRGLNMGVDFTGGRNYVIRFDRDVTMTEVAGLLEGVYGQAPDVKTYGGDNQVKIVTSYKYDEEGAEVDREVEQKLFEGLKPILGDISFDDFNDNHKMSSIKVGATIADDIAKQAVLAILFSLIIIFLYIFLRFKNWQYGLGALVALIHDVMIILGIFSIFYTVMPFSLEIDQAFIAAILTVLGYSINDTVVVFDRIREYIGLYPKRERGEITNTALNSTLSRTFSTSLSTFAVLFTIFLFGGEVIRGFVFALMVGVVVGTYSSLFIATPVVFDTIKTKKKIQDKIKKK